MAKEDKGLTPMMKQFFSINAPGCCAFIEKNCFIIGVSPLSSFAISFTSLLSLIPILSLDLQNYKNKEESPNN